MSSRLFQEVREKRGLAYSIYATQAGYQGAGQWCIYAGTRVSHLGEVVGVVEQELSRIASEKVSKEELKRTIDFISGQLLLGLETTNSHMGRLGKREVLGLEQTTPEEQVAAYKAVTTDDILRLAQDLLTKTPAIAVVSPQSQAEIEAMLSQVH